MLGILLIDKPTGMTSHDVVNVLRRRLGTRRIGHAGTLDPLASGLLVLGVGPATRFLQFLSLEPKQYVATISFGRETTTQDAEGEVVAYREVPTNLSELLSNAIPAFIGLIEQIPPMYSAVKVAGKALYRYARAGIDVERKTRRVFVHSIDIESCDGSNCVARITCSGGTYVRTLAHDLGLAIGTGAHLASLRRTAAGSFTVGVAADLEAVEPKDLIPLAQAISPMPVLPLSSADIDHVRHGRRIHAPPDIASELVALADSEGTVLGVGRIVGSMIQPECVIPQEVAHDRV